MPPRHKYESFGQELVIEDVQYGDAGKYECQGLNDQTIVPIRRSMHLAVECKYFMTVMSHVMVTLSP